jgi:hypothetical protein
LFIYIAILLSTVIIFSLINIKDIQPKDYMYSNKIKVTLHEKNKIPIILSNDSSNQVIICQGLKQKKLNTLSYCEN